MRQHSNESEDTALRPKTARIDPPTPAYINRAAAAGRTDVLSEADVLGLQRTVGNAGVSALVEDDRSPVHDVVSSGGRPLDEPVRADMESRLGHDFGDVRVHDDSAAQASAGSVGAHAYTVGSDIVFQRDAYDPSSVQGQRTLAHELTHVVQQRHGPVDGTPAAGGVKISDPTDRFEQEAATTAERVTTPQSGAVAAAAPAAADVQRDSVDPAVQREEAPAEEEEEPTAQGLFVQREDVEEEPDEGQL